MTATYPLRIDALLASEPRMDSDHARPILCKWRICLLSAHRTNPREDMWAVFIDTGARKRARDKTKE